LHEAEGKLSDAVKAGSMDQIDVAHTKIGIARKRMSETTNKRKRCVDKNKRNLDSSLRK